MKKQWMLIILLLYLIIIIIGAVIAIPSRTINNYDKFLHFLEYYLLIIILLKTLQLYNVKHYYVVGLLCVLLFIPFSEYIQTFTKTRTFSYYDMLADLAGIIVGAVNYRLLFTRISSRK